MVWLELIIQILIGLSVLIPLVIKLVEYVKKAVKEKNWNIIIGLVLEYMAIAEEKFTDNADRKEWVLAMVAESAKTVNYDLDITVIAKLIDDLCTMAKKVNVKK